MATSVKVGDKFPDFCLPDQNGDFTCTQNFRGQNMIIYFYPKDDTKICIAEACSFNTHLPMFRELDAVVLGISSDSTPSHQSFHSKYNLNFKLLSDSDSRIRSKLGIVKLLGLIPARVTYVIDKKGVVVQVISNLFSAEKHVKLSLKKLKELKST